MFFFRTSYSFCKGTNLLSVKKGNVTLVFVAYDCYSNYYHCKKKVLSIEL